MIRLIREKLAVVLWFVIAAFIATIVFEWGMGGFRGPEDIRSKGYIARINGENISFSELRQIEERYIRDISDRERDESGLKVAEVRQQAWKDMIRIVAIRQELEKQNIILSSDHIYHEILNNPIEDVRNIPEFMTNGTFDLNKYQDFIKNPSPQFEHIYLQLEFAAMRLIPSNILESRVTSSLFLSEYELIQKFRDKHMHATVSYLMADASDFAPDDSEVTEDQLLAYFNDNPHEFIKVPEQRSFEYVLFSTARTAADSVRSAERLEQVVNQLENGVPFDQVARSYSDDPSAEKGGDLGFISRGMMVPEFEEAAFSTPIGETTGPVKTRFGHHIIKVTDHRTVGGELTEVRARHILIMDKTYRETFDNAINSAVNFRDEMNRMAKKTGSFESAASKLGLEIRHADFTSRSDSFRDLGMVPGLGDFLFSNESGDVSSILTSSAGYLILRIKDIKPESERKLEDVKNTVMLRTKRKIGIERAYEELQKISGSVTDVSSMKTVAEENENIKFGQDVKILPTSRIEGAGIERLMYEIAMLLEPESLYGPFKGSIGAYIVYLVEKDEFDRNEYEQKKEEIRHIEELLLARSVTDKWVDNLVKEAEVIDYRGHYR